MGKQGINQKNRKQGNQGVTCLKLRTQVDNEAINIKGNQKLGTIIGRGGKTEAIIRLKAYNFQEEVGRIM